MAERRLQVRFALGAVTRDRKPIVFQRAEESLRLFLDRFNNRLAVFVVLAVTTVKMQDEERPRSDHPKL